MKKVTILKKSDVHKFENQESEQDITGKKPRKDRRNDGQSPCVKQDTMR